MILDYRGIDAVPSARADYVYLVKKLADRLHANNKTLAVRVESPRQVSADAWDTLGFDWPGLGAVVDTLIVPAPLDPTAYAPGGAMDTLMTWATSQVERRKIQVELPGLSVERAGDYLLPMGYQQALRPLLAQVSAQDTGSGEELALGLDNPRLLSHVTWDDQIGAYVYSYLDDQGYERTVYLETAGSIGRKLGELQKYNVRNVSVATPAGADVDPNLWNVLLQFQQGGDLSGIPNQLSVSYRVTDPSGAVLTQEVRPIDDARVVVRPAAAGDLRVEAQVLNANGQPLGEAQLTNVAWKSDQPAAVAAVAAPEVAGVDQAAPVAKESAVTAAAAVPVEPGVLRVAASQIVNVREGPSTAYPVLGQLGAGSSYVVTGKTEAGDWWQVDKDGAKAWVIGQLVNTSGDASQIAVITDIPAPPAGAAAAPAAPAAAAAPVVAAPAPAGGGSFGYGMQAHMVHNDQAGTVSCR